MKEYCIEQMKKAVNNLAITRRSSMQFMSVDEIDQIIVETSKELFAKFDKMSDNEFALYLLNGILEPLKEMLGDKNEN